MLVNISCSYASPNFDIQRFLVHSCYQLGGLLLSYTSPRFGIKRFLVHPCYQLGGLLHVCRVCLRNGNAVQAYSVCMQPSPLLLVCLVLTVDFYKTCKH